MKFILTVFLLAAFSSVAMDHDQQESTGEPGEDIKSNVPSLKVLAFKKIHEEMMPKVWWQVERIDTHMQDVMEREKLFGNTVFEKARRVEMYGLKNIFQSTAQEVAEYIDEHHTASERKYAVLELEKLSKAMRKAIAQYRKN
jgi:hypothetical protein